jgi:hypothetical protein
MTAPEERNPRHGLTTACSGRRCAPPLMLSVRECREKPAECERVQVPDSEGLATHAGPEACVADGNDGREALTGECAGRVESPEIG